MIQRNLLDELSAMIRLGLEERSVPITQAGWVIEWASGPGWQLTVRLQPGIPLLVAPNQLVVFREEEEISPVLVFLPPPPFDRRAFMAAARAEPKSREERQRLAAGAERRSLIGIKDIGELRAVRESVMAASLKLDPEFFEPVRPEETASFRALLVTSVAALTGVVEALDELIDRMQDLT